MVLRKGIRKIKQGMKIYNNQLSVLRNELRTCKRKSTEQGKQICEQQKLLAEQQKQALEYANRLDENDKKNEEMARKFSTLLQELNKCKTELQYWRSNSPAMATCNSCGQKMTTTVLPTEDFQALINQGVKAENLILNLHNMEENNIKDELEINCENLATNNNNKKMEANVVVVVDNNEFALPNETTTAKLLTANKKLKRQYSSTTTTIASTSHINTEPPNVAFAENSFNMLNGIDCSPTQHNGVIVSPKATINNSLLIEQNVEDVGGGLIIINPPETKKARRVQKSTRCLNASGKRSK